MRIAPFCLLSIALLPSLAAAAAETCTVSANGTKTCAQIHIFNAQDLEALRLVPAPASGVTGVDDSSPWIAQSGIAPPLDVKPADTGASLRTSTSQWRDFENQILARRIDEAKAANKSLPQPKAPAVIPSPVELWTSVDFAGLAESSDSAVKTSAGANYKLSRTTTFGVEATRADTRPVTALTGTQDDKFAGFVTYQATSMVSIDARTHWETATSGSSRTDTNAVSVAPKLKVPMKLSNGQTLEPFVTIKDELSRSEAADLGQTRNAISAGTGVTFAKPGSYTMSLTADAENLNTPDPATYKSRFQLSVPLK